MSVMIAPEHNATTILYSCYSVLGLKALQLAKGHLKKKDTREGVCVYLYYLCT